MFICILLPTGYFFVNELSLMPYLVQMAMPTPITTSLSLAYMPCLGQVAVPAPMATSLFLAKSATLLPIVDL